MAFKRHILSWYLTMPTMVLLLIVSSGNVLSQQFVTPEVPLGQRIDGQTFGDFRGQSIDGRPLEGHPVDGSVVQDSIVEGRVIEGRVIEGRVLTGENGQTGDMTLRYPDSSTTGRSNSVDNGNNSGQMVFGPIEIEPSTAVTPNQMISPPRRQVPRATSGRRSQRKVALREIPNREIVRQRYPDGNIHIARHVMQDADGNWVNDGQWKLFDQQGAMIASGTYRNGAMEGKWSRLHTAGSGGIFDNAPFIEFDGPYASHANFESGELSGPWIIEDRRGKKIFEMPYNNGKRNGVAVWHRPQGKIYRRMEFKDDVPVGNLVEYDNRGIILRKETYKDGMKIVNNVTYYRPSGQKRQESIVFRGRLELQGDDDWWEAQPAPMVVTGQDVQHGPIRSWYENGQTKMVGNLVKGVRVGQFVWWHRNGTKQLVGQYDKAGNKTDRWRWWHENGIKSIDGSYTDGQPDGPWQWWNDQGELINEETFDPKEDSADSTSAISIDLLDAENDNPDDQPAGDVTGDSNDKTTIRNPEDPFGENFDEDGDTDDLEGIEPESFEAEEIPEPDTAQQMPASLSGERSDSAIEAFFQIRDDQ